MNDYYTNQYMFNEENYNITMYSVKDDPITYEEACKDDKWVQVLNIAIERKPYMRIRWPSSWNQDYKGKQIDKIKLNELGKVEKYKAKLVVKWYA